MHLALSGAASTDDAIELAIYNGFSSGKERLWTSGVLNGKLNPGPNPIWTVIIGGVRLKARRPYWFWMSFPAAFGGVAAIMGGYSTQTFAYNHLIATQNDPNQAGAGRVYAGVTAAPANLPAAGSASATQGPLMAIREW